jgi:hypothetical protein
MTNQTENQRLRRQEEVFCFFFTDEAICYSNLLEDAGAIFRLIALMM